MSRRFERIFTKPSEISRHLFCPICTEVFLEPTRLFCGHTFCQKCLSHWIKDNNTCPICRSEVMNELMGKDIIADKIIQDLEVQCGNQECQWKDRLENLDKHIKACSFFQPPEWLSRATDIIEIDDEKPSKHIIYGDYEKLNVTSSRESTCLNLFERVFSMQKDVRKVLENTHSRAPTQNLSIYDTSTTFYDDFMLTLSDDSAIEKTKEKKKRRDRVITLTENSTPQKEELSIYEKRKREKLKDKLSKTQKDELEFFGLKQWIEPQNTSDQESLEIIFNMSQSKTMNSKRRMPRTRRVRTQNSDQILDLDDENFETILKKSKTMTA